MNLKKKNFYFPNQDNKKKKFQYLKYLFYES